MQTMNNSLNRDFPFTFHRNTPASFKSHNNIFHLNFKTIPAGSTSNIANGNLETSVNSGIRMLSASANSVKIAVSGYN